MATSTIPQAVIDQIAATKGVISSAITLINSIGERLQAAHDAALENGATADELAPVQLAITELAAETDSLSAAVAANP